MILAAHFLIEGQGDVVQGAALDIADGKLKRIIQMGSQIHELPCMEFHAGVLIPALPELAPHWTKLQELRQSAEAPHWLQTLPPSPSYELHLEWMLALQAANVKINLPQLIPLFCTELPQLLGINENRLQLHAPVHVWLISGIDYTSFRIKEDAKLRKLV